MQYQQAEAVREAAAAAAATEVSRLKAELLEARGAALETEGHANRWQQEAARQQAELAAEVEARAGALALAEQTAQQSMLVVMLEAERRDKAALAAMEGQRTAAAAQLRAALKSYQLQAAAAESRLRAEAAEWVERVRATAEGELGLWRERCLLAACGRWPTDSETALLKKQQAADVAVDETVILLHPPLPLVGVSTVMERERQQNDSLVNG